MLGVLTSPCITDLTVFWLEIIIYQADILFILTRLLRLISLVHWAAELLFSLAQEQKSDLGFLLPCNRPLLHSNMQWHQVKVRVDKNTANIRKNIPQSCPATIIQMHWSGMLESGVVWTPSCSCYEIQDKHWLCGPVWSKCFPVTFLSMTLVSYFLF